MVFELSRDHRLRTGAPLQEVWRRQVGDRIVVIVSTYFPPSTLAGVHRARHLAKHLPYVGWHPIVLCVDERLHEQRLDPALAALVPVNTEIVKVGALPVRLTRRFGVGEISLRAWIPLKQALLRLLATRSIGAVLITGSPFYPMLLARKTKRCFRIPVVLDFQDPWVSAWGADQPMFSKAGLSHKLAIMLEPRALRGSDFVTSVSEQQNAEMAARYPWLNTDRMAAIPIGGDPEDFATLRAASQNWDAAGLPTGFFHLNYVGTFLPRAGSLVRVIFRAYARLRATNPLLAARIRLNFVGTSNQPNDTCTFRVKPIAEAEGVVEAVHEIPQRVPYLSALNILAQARGILLIGSDEPHYTASKIYPALMSGRPFLSLFHRASSAHAILSAAGGGRAFAFETQGELDALEIPLAEGLRTLVCSPETFGIPNPQAYAPFEARAVAASFAKIFDHLATPRIL